LCKLASRAPPYLENSPCIAALHIKRAARVPKTPFHHIMVDSPTPRKLTLTLSGSTPEGQQHGAKPVSLDSSYSSPQVLAPFYHGAPLNPAVFFPSESSQTRRPPNSHRRLPMPPVHVSHSPSAPTSSTSSSGLSPTAQLSTSRRQFVFVL
jgi:hypothetical protein